MRVAKAKNPNVCFYFCVPELNVTSPYQNKEETKAKQKLKQEKKFSKHVKRTLMSEHTSCPVIGPVH